VSEVQDNSVNLWEEGKVEDELSPEEIQMVCSLRNNYVIQFTKCLDLHDSVATVKHVE